MYTWVCTCRKYLCTRWYTWKSISAFVSVCSRIPIKTVAVCKIAPEYLRMWHEKTVNLWLLFNQIYIYLYTWGTLTGAIVLGGSLSRENTLDIHESATESVDLVLVDSLAITCMTWWICERKDSALQALLVFRKSEHKIQKLHSSLRLGTLPLQWNLAKTQKSEHLKLSLLYWQHSQEISYQHFCIRGKEAEI